MQRSSSFILGAEQGWQAEKTFYNAVLEQIKQGVEFIHVVSLEGLTWHLGRKHSHFPETQLALSRLSHTKANKVDAVTIEGTAGKTWYIHKIPEARKEPDLKPDRQARTFIVELANGVTEGVMVVDLGGMQCCFQLTGPKMAEFLNTCRKFYDDCELLTWTDLDCVLSQHAGKKRT